MVKETNTRVPPSGNVPRDQCIEMVKDHLRANNYAVPANLADVIDDFCCRNTTPGKCSGDDRPPVKKLGRITFHQIIQGTKTLMDWKLKDGGKLVPDQEAEARAAICGDCKENVPTAGCEGCKGRPYRELVDRIVGGSRQSWDKKLGGCTICGCSLVAKTRLPLESILRHTPEKQLERFPDHCWIKVEETPAIGDIQDGSR